MKSGVLHYRFGPFVLIPSEHALLREGKPVRLTRKDFELLVILVERAGHLVRKEELQERLWPDSIVEEGNLTKHVSTLRKALGEEGEGRFVETVPRVGLRFVAPVERKDEVAATPGAVERTRVPVFVRWAVGIVLILTAVAAARVGFSPMRKGSGANDHGSWSAVAVLPFTTLGGNQPDGLGLGLADGIITRLSGQSALPVRPTASVRRYLGADRPEAAAIGRALNVGVILEGHIQRADEAVRVTVQLIDVQAGTPVWAQTFDQPAAELFVLEDSIAERVASELRLQLAAAEQQRLRRRYTENAAAYIAYVEGRESLFRYTPTATREAVGAFERALALDQGYTLARAGLAMASAEMYLRYAPEREVQQWGERAQREAETALALDPDLAEAHLARAAVFRKREFDWDQTIAASRRALLLNPNLEQPHFFTAAAFYHLGLMEQALAEKERGHRVGGSDLVEPLRIEGLVALFSGDFDLARQRLEEVSRRSSRPIGDTYLALAHYYSGDVARARMMLDQLATEPSASTSTRSRAALASILGASGDIKAARRLLEGVLGSDYRDHHVAYNVGTAFAQLGEHEKAVEWLRTAADTGFPCETWFSEDPLLNPLRTNRLFNTLVLDLTSRRNQAAARYAR